MHVVVKIVVYTIKAELRGLLQDHVKWLCNFTGIESKVLLMPFLSKFIQVSQNCYVCYIRWNFSFYIWSCTKKKLQFPKLIYVPNSIFQKSHITYSCSNPLNCNTGIPHTSDSLTLPHLWNHEIYPIIDTENLYIFLNHLTSNGVTVRTFLQLRFYRKTVLSRIFIFGSYKGTILRTFHKNSQHCISNRFWVISD